MTGWRRNNLFKRSCPISSPLLSKLRTVRQTTWAALRYTIILVGVVWIIEVVNTVLGHRLNHFGIYPRELSALKGLLFWPYLHGGYAHLLVNTAPLLVMGFFVAAKGLKFMILTTLVIQLLAGLGVWLFGREAFHIGSSGLVFGYFGLLVSLAWFERNLTSFTVAGLMVFYYGGILWGVVPQESFISWEAHLFGLFAGVVAANLFAKNRKSSWP